MPRYNCDRLSAQDPREFLEPAGIRHVMGVDLRAPGDLEGRLRLSRSPEEPPFDEGDRALLEPLVEHLRRALHLHQGSRFSGRGRLNASTRTRAGPTSPSSI